MKISNTINILEQLKKASQEVTNDPALLERRGVLITSIDRRDYLPDSDPDAKLSIDGPRLVVKTSQNFKN
jgi:hypothetical protein